MSARIGRNVTSQLVQRNLADASSRLSTSLERLSSGLRINRASDDAAGLAISDRLNMDVRVYTQASRNLNDAVSFITIAQGAYDQLKLIVTRQKELAEQSANGTYNLTQRRALNAEAAALTEEYNRILNTTTFNGVRVIKDAPSSVVFQGGYGEAQTLSVGVGNEASVSIGTGTFNTAGAGWANLNMVSADLNGDGRTDLLGSNGSMTRLSQADGSFAPQRATSASFASPTSYTAADLDGDGDMDLAGVSGASLAVYYNNGQGAFSGGAVAALSGGQVSGAWAVTAGDFNGDGRTDIAAAYNGNVAGVCDVNVFRNGGDGQFTLSQFFANGSYYQARLAADDLNNDGKDDLAIGDKIYLSSSTGNLQYKTAISGTTGSGATGCYFVDLNRDGNLDYLAAKGSAIWSTTLLSYAFGNGSGGFSSASNITLSYNVRPYSGALSLADLNNDGYQDVVIGEDYAGKTFTLLNDKGTLKITSVINDNSLPAITADLNGDGVVDFLNKNNSYLAVTTRSQKQIQLDLTNVEGSRSALTSLDRQLERLNLEVASLGVSESRLQTAISVLHSSRENMSAARSRILDVDIAFESAQLTANSILVQAGASILAQANQAPNIALALLKI